ncbi:hypothetical protein N7463_003214 [Penicillium fimorum]|uniref:Uncharacterized protein n=1 Tax=Penicillium fimorum TaxID=1882269 RepID=A0A9X0C980_9EURO|nr:hypothetical protein N7463_003214 [Penicillium fimorum]
MQASRDKANKAPQTDTHLLSYPLLPILQATTGASERALEAELDTGLPHTLTVMLTQMITTCISRRKIREESRLNSHARYTKQRNKVRLRMILIMASLVPMFRSHVLRLQGDVISKSILRLLAATPLTATNDNQVNP